jgi:acetate kinase
MKPRYLAVLNAGSSSIKFAVRGAGPEVALIFRGQIEAIGVAPRLELKDADGAPLHEQKWQAAGFDHDAATRAIITVIQKQLGTGAISAVGHRVVHGGTRHVAPERVDAALLADLETLVPLAPLHQPHNLGPIRAIAAAVPDLPQVACFDTSFHVSQPMIARSYALPRALREEGVLRYGFHGISYEFVSHRLRDLAPRLAAGRVVIAHLGNGASLCAVHNGRSVASTMGFTAVEGLMMGTRCGSIDPGVLVYLMDQHKMGPREIESLIYRRSGLLGVSGISSDMRVLHGSASAAAAEAIALFVYRAIREIGSMAAALGGLDGLVFTAGIGEHDPAIRDQIVAGCAWLGLKLDPDLNKAGKCSRISSEQSPKEVWIIPTDEERMIAEHTAALLNLAAAA